MAYHYENQCVDCDIPCINCGRKRVLVLECDKCGEEVDELYYDEVTGENICFECLKDSLETKEGICEECGDESILYCYDGKWLCSYDLGKIAEKLDVEGLI